MYTIQKALQKAQQDLQKVTDTPALDAEILLAEVLQCSRTTLHTWPEKEIAEDKYQAYLELCNRRAAGVPIAYLLGQQSFWKFTLKVTPDVLIPRPETELVVELILELFADKPELSVADLGTGSGAIALALAYENPSWEITATDNSLAALAVAQENAENLQITQIHWQQSNWYFALGDQKFNVIVSNPPYIAPGDPHLFALQHEPPAALVAEEQGLDDLQKIISQAPQHLLADGYLFVEHGYQQAPAVQALMKTAGLVDIQTYVDLAGQPRVTQGFKKS